MERQDVVPPVRGKEIAELQVERQDVVPPVKGKEIIWLQVERQDVVPPADKIVEGSVLRLP
ncbi:MAG TPA: hypothetical protein PKI37_01160 [Candidatus Cloacimonas sp.]|nr:hypothetical protein [Candidatus Cloacimonas sp.]